MTIMTMICILLELESGNSLRYAFDVTASMHKLCQIVAVIFGLLLALLLQCC